MDFAVEDANLEPYVEELNGLLDAKWLPRYRVEDLRGEMNQLKALVDLCHLHGLWVILDASTTTRAAISAMEASTSSIANPDEPRARHAVHFHSLTGDPFHDQQLNTLDSRQRGDYAPQVVLKIEAP
jgi:hypothetical protein